jgi:hypothetical protein
MKRARRLLVVSIALGALLPALGCAAYMDLFADGGLNVQVAEFPWAISVGERGVLVSPAVY